MLENSRLGRSGGAAGKELDRNAQARIVLAIGVRNRLLHRQREIIARIDRVALPRRKPGHPVAIADHQRRSDAGEQRTQIGVSQPVVERAIGNPCQRSAEHRDHARLARFVEQRDEVCAAAADQFARAARGGQQGAISPALALTNQANALAGTFGRHLQK